MFRLHSIVTLFVFAVSIPVLGANQNHPKKPKARPAPVQPQPQQVQEQQAPPQPPPTPEQGPSSPPEVTLKSGQLTIVARNSTLGDVLNAVRAKTGASVEMSAASSERVAGQFGPGAPRDVMAQLLNGSHYDYVLLGSPAEPGALKKVVLTARATGPEPVPQPSNQVPAYNQAMQPAQVDQDQPTEDVNSTDVQPDAAPPAEQEEPQGEQPPQPPPGTPGVKTPEQLLRELQQQQQQQQQGGQPPQQ